MWNVCLNAVWGFHLWQMDIKLVIVELLLSLIIDRYQFLPCGNALQYFGPSFITVLQRCSAACCWFLSGTKRTAKQSPGTSPVNVSLQAVQQSTPFPPQVLFSISPANRKYELESGSELRERFCSLERSSLLLDKEHRTHVITNDPPFYIWNFPYVSSFFFKASLNQEGCSEDMVPVKKKML